MTFEQFIFDARNLITVLSFLSFIGIVWWTYGAHRGADFDTAAQLPFADDNDTAASEKQHG
ncbi:cbb3-type cytochrome oxidase subunit 3 [Noviherbaspirillum aerium]|uniref:cbb3-type cytochrome oxidase subunit 3 n=1 Tax=Noviherbaspirillum aerium TaxID=2588497 RepID=UPI00124D83DE|nr:CcoQ/FixQ family Cbb3-type cytochrome c oxidase assembly chaperone [Noviherbaspirillum aerium]